MSLNLDDKIALLVTKNSILRKMYLNFLKEAGFGAIIITGKEVPASQFLETQKVDLLLVDHDLPAQNGVEFCEWTMENISNVRILLTSGWPKGEFVDLLSKNNMHFLQKPYTFEEFMDVIRDIFKEA